MVVLANRRILSPLRLPVSPFGQAANLTALTGRV
jgi:hypothetical protein